MGGTRREIILGEARQQFLAKGYSGTAVGDIAHSLGLSKAAITYYFPRKQAFLSELIDPLLADLERIALDELGEGDWPDGARATLTKFCDRLVDDHDLAKWIMTDRALLAADVYGPRVNALNTSLIVCIVGSEKVTERERARALAVVGGIWRPVLELESSQLVKHRTEIVDAALVSFRPLS